MLRFCTLFLCVFFLRFSAAQSFVISGTVAHLPDQWLMLSYLNDSLHTVVDSAFSRNGHFEFNGFINEPSGAGLYSTDGKLSTVFFFDTDSTDIRGDADLPTPLKIHGGKSTRLYAEFMGMFTTQEAHNDSLRTEAFHHSADSTVFENLWRRYSESVQEAAQVRSDWMVEHKTSVVNAYILLYHYIDAEQLADGDRLMKLMSPKVQQSKYARARAKARFTTALREVGKTMKNFSLPDTSGKPISTEQFRGKYFLLDFWASWCKPCRELSPGLVAAYHKYHPMGFEILSISLDVSRRSWTKAIAEDSLVWTQVSSLRTRNDAATLYDVQVLPANFLINPDGKVIGEYLWGEQLNDRLNEIYGK